MPIGVLSNKSTKRVLSTDQISFCVEITHYMCVTGLLLCYGKKSNAFLWCVACAVLARCTIEAHFCRQKTNSLNTLASKCQKNTLSSARNIFCLTQVCSVCIDKCSSTDVELRC